MNKKFDTEVQHLKYRVLKEVAKHAFDGTLMDGMYEIPKTIVPGKEATMRCCVYKERAIVEERIKIAMGGDKENPNVIEVIDIACDECPVGGHVVTDSCRGCIAHRCEAVCPRGAISFDANKRAHIDKSKCIECGMCAKVCPYGAITYEDKEFRMSDRTTKVRRVASVNPAVCQGCGACTVACPSGAMDLNGFASNQIMAEVDAICK